MLELSLILLLGLMAGIIVGLLPGLPQYVGLLMLYPLIQYMSIEQIMVFWLACQIGSQYFGSVAAILLKIPGEASSIIFLEDIDKIKAPDRYDLIRQTAWGSTVASLVSLSLLLFVYYIGLSEHLLVLTNINTKMVVLTILMLTLIYFTKSRWIAALMFFGGLAIAPKSNHELPNWIWHMQDVTTDVTVFSLLLGAMIIPEFLKELQSKLKGDNVLDLKDNKKRSKLDFKSMFRGTWLGSLIGFIPGPSAILASIITYNSHKDKSKIKERITSSESANNSAAVSSMLPFLFVGLPITLSEMILSDIMAVKTFVLPLDLKGETVLPGVNYIEFCFLLVMFLTVCYHFLAQSFLKYYEKLMIFAHGKLLWVYVALVIYLVTIDTMFNPVYMPRYLMFMALMTLGGIWLLKRQISVLPLIFGFVLGDMITWAVYNFYRINFY